VSDVAVDVSGVWKNFRLYRERNQYIKAALLRGRRARYEEFWALKGVSFQVGHGETFGIIGANGSGKSTMLKCLARILVPDEGHIAVNGRVAALLELGAGFHPDLSGVENIYLNGAILGMSRRDIESRFDRIVEFSGLSKFIDSPVKNYSSGMTIRLGFSIAAHVDPEILLIDEVLSVGDQSFQRRSLEKIEEFRRDGRTIIFVSHGLSQVQQLCETAAWLDKGELRMIGPSSTVIAEYTGESLEAQPRLEGEIGDRWGTGEAQITSVELLDSAGARMPYLVTERPVRIRISFTTHLPVFNPVIGVRVTHLNGVVVWGMNTKRRAAFIDRINGPGYVEIEIPSLPLLEGTYELTVAISDQSEVHDFDHWEKRVRFDVHQHDVFDEGLITVASTWHVDEAEYKGM
jgi:ABC-type polysaccharide/polyol phosphate transport system ATPase subunit